VLFRANTSNSEVKRIRARAYLFAIVMVGLAFALRILLVPLTGTGAPFVLFFAAVLTVTFFGGARPGLLAVLLSVPLATHAFAIRADYTWTQVLGQAVLFSIDGLLTVFIATASATRARRRAESVAAAMRRSERRFRGIFELSPEGIAVIDSSRGLFLEVNRRYCEIVGYTSAEMLEADFMSLTHPDDLPADLENMEALRRGQIPMFTMEKRYLHRQGQVVWVELTVVPIWLEGECPNLHLAMVQDITERKRAHEERERLVLALREADQHKNEFLGVLAHELRNPLSPIRNSLYILQQTTPGGEQARRAEAVIERQVNQLTRLVDDLLDLTRISCGKIRLQRRSLNLVDIVRQTVEDHRTVLAGRDVSVELPEQGVWISGDPTRLTQMIGNLLHNAAKFTPSGEKVLVSLTSTEQRAAVEIVDTGVGIDADMLPKLFEPFSQAERSLARTRGGLGLGLALVKGLVEQHGGQVEAHSDGPGTGARFTLEFPLDEQAIAPLEARPAHTVDRGRKVLIIEDNPDLAESLKEALQFSDHEVLVASDGRQGIKKARDFKPEVLLCDIGLPEMDGYEVARALREDPELKDVFLVALSGYAGPEDQRRAAEAGFDRHVGKPPSMEQLGELFAQAPRRATHAPLAASDSPASSAMTESSLSR
jgi:two-component system CheB/CheR fusion protein